MLTLGPAVARLAWGPRAAMGSFRGPSLPVLGRLAFSLPSIWVASAKVFWGVVNFVVVCDPHSSPLS